MDHYEVLGLKSTATAAEIKSAYRKIVLRHHPDRSKDPRSKPIFLKATEAYEVIGDEERRRAYDAQRDFVQRQRRAAQAPPKADPPKQAPPKPREPEPPSIQVEVARLTLLHNRGQSGEAERLALEILSRDPRQAIPHAVLGDIAQARGDLNEAQRRYAYAAQMDPRNTRYQQRYEQLLAASRIDDSGKRARLESEPAQVALPAVAAGASLAAAIYLAVAGESAVLGPISIVSTWTLGLLILLFLCGAITGGCLSAGGIVDRFEIANTTATGRYGPSVTLGLIAIVSFPAAVFLYLLVGLAQRGFNRSTTRLVAGVAGVVLLFALATQFGGSIHPLQVLMWGGNLAYLGALVGWLVADAMRGGLDA